MKQQQITYDKGITYVPSDVLCSDNALSENVGLTYENGEMKPIQNAQLAFDGAQDTSTPPVSLTMPTILYVHKFNNEKRYIGYTETTTTPPTYPYCWYEETSGSTKLVYKGGLNSYKYMNGAKISSIGKILIISDGNGLHYFLWKQDSYEPMNYPVPDINMDVKLYEPSIGSAVGNSGKCEGITSVYALRGEVQDDGGHVLDGETEEYNNLIVGLYSKNIKNVASKKGFAKPFALRMALELYDGTYTYITNPVLLFPCVSMSTCGFFYGETESLGLWSEAEERKSLYLETFFSKLYIKQTTDYSDFHDIVKDVVLFVTKGTSIYNLSDNQPFEYLNQDGDPVVVHDSVCADDPDLSSAPSEYRTFMNGASGQNDEPNGDVYDCLKKRSAVDIKNDLENDTVFYKLCSLGTKPINSFVDVGTLTPDYVFENITTQEQLGDDYFSRNRLVPNFLHSYNSRLNLANVSRGLFEGYDFFMPFDWSNNAQHIYNFYVKIKLDAQSVWVAHTMVQTSQKQGIFFFYPDSRAEHVTIYRVDSGSDVCVCDAKLKESESLNGAYYFKELPTQSTDEETVQVGSDGFHIGQDTYNNNAVEVLTNYIIQSEVNNPFVFRPEGYFKVGTGKIIGCSTITQALSEGQFGQFPLLVFSESGIWALTVGSTGYYTSIHPISREVCSEASSITQTDGAVYFVSEKGLMVIVGNAVKCVSEQFDGKVFDNAAPFGFVLDGDFETYLKGCRIAYDYRDSQLVIINSSATFQWVYNMKSSTFSKAHLIEGAVGNILNDYPDSLLQASDGKVYSLLKKPDQNADLEDYDCVLLTRPMKLENGLALKTIMDMKNIGTMEGTLVVTIYGSNDCQHWMEVPSLTGIPWKYHRFKIVFSDMKATDRFSGTLLVTQERRTNKLR